MIMNSMYSNTPDGLCGNDDAGQMSAWYIFSALGFYPVSPGSVDYSIGSPMVTSAIIKLENGKQISIGTKNQGPKNVYIQKITLNGKPINRRHFTHSELMNGIEIIYYMGKKPNKKW